MLNQIEVCSDCRTNKLGFTPEFLGRVKLVTSVASLIGVGLYNGFLKKVPLRKIFLVLTLIGTAVGMTQVHVPTHIFYFSFIIFLLFTVVMIYFQVQCFFVLGSSCDWIEPAVWD